MEPEFSFTPEYFANPFPALAHLRQDAPISKIKVGGRDTWLVTRFDDAVAVLKDDRFSLRPTGAAERRSVGVGGPLGSSPHLLSTDGLDHRRLRDLVGKGFTPRFVEGLRPQIEGIAQRLLDAIEASGARTFDFIEAFAFPLPIDVIMGMLGLPPADRTKFRHWSDAIFSTIGSPDADSQADMDAFVAYLSGLFEEKRQHPGDDLISALVLNDGADDALSHEELIAMVMLLIFAGHETTVNLLGNGLLALLTRPEVLARLRAEPELMPSAVEELLRLEGPVTMPGPRFATEDVTLDGHTILAGESVLVALASANRDESRFKDPDELDIARELNKHLAFGQGVHYCLGAPLARLEAQVALAAVLDRFPNLALDADPAALAWRANPALRGLQTLPLRY